MKRDVKREARALQRIVALLVALAQLADRAGAMPFPVRVVVLAILRHAEAVAWAFALGTACVPAACGRIRPQHRAPPGAPVRGRDGSAEAARLALGLRTLALIVASCAIRALSSMDVPPAGRRAMAPACARPGGNWRGPGALPAPDTS